MELEIETLQKDFKGSGNFYNESKSISIEEAFFTTKTYKPSLNLLTKLREIELQAKADYHYLNTLKAKTFNIIYEEDYESELSLIEKCLFSFKFCRLERKILMAQQKLFVQKLTSNLHYEKSNKEKVKKANEFHQAKLLKAIFQEFSSYVKIKVKEDIFLEKIAKNRRIEFLECLKEHARKNKLKRTGLEREEEEINKIFAIRSLNKHFTSLRLFSKHSKLEKSIKKKYFKKFTIKISVLQNEKLSRIEIFKETKRIRLLAQIFGALKDNKLQSQCFDWYCYRLQKVYFQNWIRYLSITKNEQEIEAYNDVIAQHFIDSKNAEKKEVIQKKCFDLWKSFTILQKEEKKETKILKSFAELKEKEYLERKYFEILKNNKNFEKASKFYKVKLKNTSFESLKLNVRKENEKLEKINKFIGKRSFKKYFDRIQLFIDHEKRKINFYRLNIAWSKFTFNIAMDYFQKVEKAKNYYEILLKFKSLIGLKELIEFNRKAEHCEKMINFNFPLKRWILRYRLRGLVEEKEFNTLKRTFFEWRVMTVRKSLSSEKLRDTSELYVESRIFENKNTLQRNSENSIFSQCKKETSQIEKKEASFFMKMQDSNSEEDDDEVEKKANALLTKLKGKKSLKSKEVPENQMFTNEKLIFANKSLSKNNTNETGERLRVPTWNSPDTAYRVSVFEDDFEDD